MQKNKSSVELKYWESSVELLKNCESKCWIVEELNLGIDAWKNVGVEELRHWRIEALKNKSAEEL